MFSFDDSAVGGTTEMRLQNTLEINKQDGIERRIRKNMYGIQHKPISIYQNLKH